MAGSSRRPSPPPIPSARRHRSPPRQPPVTPAPRRHSPLRLAPPKRRRQPRRSTSTLDLPVPPTPVYRGMRQRSWGSWVAEITDRNTRRKVWIGSFQSPEQAAWAYDVENVRLHGDDCGELNFPRAAGGPVPDLEPAGLRLVSDRERREDREARERLEAERRDAAMAAALAGLNPELVEEERQRLEAFAEAKRKADAVRMKKEDVGDAGPSASPAPARVKEEDVGSDAGPSTAATVIDIDSDSSFDWEED